MWSLTSKTIFFFFTCFLLTFNANSQSINGVVIDSTSQEPLEFVSVVDVSTGKGTITNSEGFFELKATLPTEIQFSFLGLKPKTITVSNETQAKNLLIEMVSNTLIFEEVVLSGEKSTIGRDIVKKVIGQKQNRLIDESFSREIYQQTVMNRFYKASEKDSIPNDSLAIVYLNEKASTEYLDGAKSKIVVQAEIKQTGDKQLKRTAPMVNGRDFRGGSQFVSYNPIEYFITPEDFKIDLYDNQLNNNSISDRPITSPIANGALLNYNYKLKEMDINAKDTLFTIAVTPKYKGAPLWDGLIYVSSDGYKLMKAELSLDPGINGFRDLTLDINYKNIENNHVASEKKISYNANIGTNKYFVKIVYRTSDYNFTPTYSKNFFSAEKVKYTEASLETTNDLMVQYRGVALEKDLNIFYTKQDSIYQELNSDEYLRKQDSIFNKITWRKVVLAGFGYRNRAKGVTYQFDGLANFFQPFGVDGFRIAPAGSFEKEFFNKDEIDVRYRLNYGLSNNDIKGRVYVGYTFLPSKFARVFVGGGDIFDVVTFFQSLDNLVSRNNFIRNRFVSGGYSMEIVNGLYLNTEVGFSNKESILDLEVNPISSFLFGSQESAIDFQQYKIFEFKGDLIYRFGQQFVTRGRKKIVLPNNNPVLTLSYRKGIPQLFGSEVNFDYVELKLNQKIPSTKLGSSNWQVRTGSFINQRSLRQLEYNFFRGSTPYLFTNPLFDAQQLGDTRSTANAFVQGAIIHHFDGFFLDKVPLIRHLQMELLAGGGTLIIPQDDLYHAEIYLGLGKKFKIWGETLQIAVYALSSDSSLDVARLDYKVGINFYNAFAREWLY